MKNWSIYEENGIIVARFDGYLDEEEGRASAATFVELYGDRSKAARFDIRTMDGYDVGARRAWAQALRPIRDQITEIQLLGGNAFVRMGGSLLGALLGIPVRRLAGE